MLGVAAIRRVRFGTVKESRDVSRRAADPVRIFFAGEIAVSVAGFVGKSTFRRAAGFLRAGLFVENGRGGFVEDDV